MKILILGGTGAMGVHIVRILEKREGVDLVVTSRNEQRSKGNVRYIRGDAKQLPFLKSLLSESWDVIIDFMVYSTRQFEERKDLLLGAAKQYIFLSSARVYANSEDPIRESSLRLLDVSKDEEYLKTDEYALTKARQENLLKNSKSKNWTIIRPYITYSENRLQLGVLEKEEWLYRALHGRSVVFSKDINNHITTLTYGYDVAVGISSVIGIPDACGEVFHITQAESISWRDVLAAYKEVFLEHGIVLKVVLCDLEKFLEVRPSRYQVCYDRLFDRTFDNTKIGKFVDVSSFKSPIDGLRECLRTFLLAPQFNRISWSGEARRDRLTGERTPLSEIQGVKNKASYVCERNIPGLMRVLSGIRKKLKF